MCRSLIRYAAAALAALAFAAPAHAEFVRSAQLFDWLGEAVKRGGSFKDTTIALGYVSGVHDSLPEGLVCLPPRAAGKALLGTVHQWMKTYPERWDAAAARTVGFALVATYPCGGSQAK